MENTELKREFEKNVNMLIVRGQVAIIGLKRFTRGNKSETTKAYINSGVIFCQLATKKYICNHIQKEGIGDLHKACETLKGVLCSLNGDSEKIIKKESIKEAIDTISNAVTYLIIQLID